MTDASQMPFPEDPAVFPDVIIEADPDPAPLPARTLVVQMQFQTEGLEPVLYSSTIEHGYELNAEQFAKVVSEIVERTALLHLGVLPVLAKQDATPAEVTA